LGIRLGQSRDHSMAVSLCGFFSVGGRKIGENAKLRHPQRRRRRRKKALRTHMDSDSYFQEQLQIKAEAAARQS